MKTTYSRRRRPNGFSTLESLGFVVALLIAGFLNFKSITTLRKTEGEARRHHGILQLETAKTRFTQDATPEDRVKFNGMSNEARFAQLAASLTPTDPIEFAKAHGFKKMDIGNLSTPPSAE